jgi:two-component system LytT family response regulator
MQSENKIKIAIIDDETPARNLIKTFLSEFDDIEIIGEAADGFSAILLINNQKPDLIFLDIKMPKLDGFEVLQLIEHKPLVIFSTAYDDFAIQAFELNAMDYLMKPYTRQRLEKALKKAKSFQVSTSIKEKEAERISDFSKHQSGALNRIAIKQNSQIVIVSVDEITHIEAQDDYVFIYTAQARYMKNERMKYLEEHLDPDIFIRVHRSFIINIQFMDKIEAYEKDSYLAILKTKKTLKVSKAGYKLLKEKLGI